LQPLLAEWQQAARKQDPTEARQPDREHGKPTWFAYRTRQADHSGLQGVKLRSQFMAFAEAWENPLEAVGRHIHPAHSVYHWPK
jgi:hypothetical protein